MTDPTPLYYQSGTPASAADESNLRVLSILHYVFGGLQILFSCFAIIYIVMGVMMAAGAMNTPPAPGATAPPPPPPAAGYFLAGCGGVGLLLGWTIGIMSIIAGRKMAKHRSRTFCMVIAGLNCISIPLGTILGIFTFIVLAKPSVREMFNYEAQQP